LINRAERQTLPAGHKRFVAPKYTQFTGTCDL
jgi:hypothetical protein